MESTMSNHLLSHPWKSLLPSLRVDKALKIVTDFPKELLSGWRRQTWWG